MKEWGTGWRLRIGCGDLPILSRLQNGILRANRRRMEIAERFLPVDGVCTVVGLQGWHYRLK
jgi:hypothetical protein